MKVRTVTPNPGLISIIQNPQQIITLDANFLIPPCRGGANKKGMEFKQFRRIWLDPVFSTFPNLAIHEAVQEELIGTVLQNYIQTMRDDIPPGIIIHTDSSLNEVERILRDTVEARIAYHTNYEPMLDNKDDRGEVKSLCYIAVKGLVYFAAHDHNAIQLIEKSEVWSTGLDNVQAIKMYELIYYLHKKEIGNRADLRMLYKYQYYLTEREKSINPNWGEFIIKMENVYETFFS